MFRFLMTLAAGVLLSFGAAAQTSPNFTDMSNIPASEWNSLFANKRDYNPNEAAPPIPTVTTCRFAVDGYLLAGGALHCRPSGFGPSDLTGLGIGQIFGNVSGSVAAVSLPQLGVAGTLDGGLKLCGINDVGCILLQSEYVPTTDFTWLFPTGVGNPGQPLISRGVGNPNFYAPLVNDNSWPITSVTNSGGLIEITLTTASDLVTGDQVLISGTPVNTGANTLPNSAATITVIDPTHFTINGSTYTNSGAAFGTVSLASPKFVNWRGVKGTAGHLVGIDPSGALVDAGTTTLGPIATLGIGAGLSSSGGNLLVPGGGITNAMLQNSSVTLGSTSVGLGSTASSLAGLTSVTASTFTGTNSVGGQFTASGVTAQYVANTTTPGFRDFIAQTNGFFRWAEGADATAETGANVGSDWFLARYNDAGVFLDSPITILRSNGIVNANNGLAVNSANGLIVTSGGNVNVANGTGSGFLTNGVPTSMATVAALRGINTTGFASGVTTRTLASINANWGGGAVYYFAPGSTCTDDSGGCVQPNAGGGRWLLSPSNAFSALIWGSDPTGGADSTNAIKNCLAWVGANYPGSLCDGGGRGNKYLIGTSRTNDLFVLTQSVQFAHAEFILASMGVSSTIFHWAPAWTGTLPTSCGSAYGDGWGLYDVFFYPLNGNEQWQHTLRIDDTGCNQVFVRNPQIHDLTVYPSSKHSNNGYDLYVSGTNTAGVGTGLLFSASIDNVTFFSGMYLSPIGDSVTVNRATISSACASSGGPLASCATDGASINPAILLSQFGGAGEFVLRDPNFTARGGVLIGDGVYGMLVDKGVYECPSFSSVGSISNAENVFFDISGTAAPDHVEFRGVQAQGAGCNVAPGILNVGANARHVAGTFVEGSNIAATKYIVNASASPTVGVGPWDPQWESTSATSTGVTCDVGSLTTYTKQTNYRWQPATNSLAFELELTITNAGTCSGNMHPTLPFALQNSIDTNVSGVDLTTGTTLRAVIGANTNTITISKYDGTSDVGARTYTISGTYNAQR